jgi:hypothetical protein
MAIKWLGIYRAVDLETVGIQKNMLKALFRRGSMTPSALANYIRVRPGDPLYVESIRLLEEWKHLETLGTGQLKLTRTGDLFATEIIGTEQKAEAQANENRRRGLE